MTCMHVCLQGSNWYRLQLVQRTAATQRFLALVLALGVHAIAAHEELSCTGCTWRPIIIP